MKRLIIFLCIILIVGHALIETATVLFLCWPEIDKIKINPWIDKNYVFYGDPEGINLKWFIKYVSEDFLWIFVFFVLVKVAYNFSSRLWYVCLMFLIYHLVDAFLLFYDYKTLFPAYFLMVACIIVCILLMFIPEKRKQNYKSII